MSTTTSAAGATPAQAAQTASALATKPTPSLPPLDGEALAKLVEGSSDAKDKHLVIRKLTDEIVIFSQPFVSLDTACHTATAGFLITILSDKLAHPANLQLSPTPSTISAAPSCPIGPHSPLTLTPSPDPIRPPESRRAIHRRAPSQRSVRLRLAPIHRRDAERDGPDRRQGQVAGHPRRGTLNVHRRVGQGVSGCQVSGALLRHRPKLSLGTFRL
jgi:hypothetical protein